MATGLEDALGLPEKSRPRLSGTGPHFQDGPAGTAAVREPRGEAGDTQPPESPRLSNPSGDLTFPDCPTSGRRLRLDQAARSRPSRSKSAFAQPEETADPMPVRGLSDRLIMLLAMARRTLHETDSDAVLIYAEWPLDWAALREKLGNCKLLVATSFDETKDGEPAPEENPPTAAPEEPEGIVWIRLDESDSPRHERLSMALLEAVADEQLRPGASVVALYRNFDEEEIDTVSVIQLDERLERLTAADLRKLETQVPLQTLKTVVDLAVEIGREGREGHPVGTIFVVGDTRKVMKQSSPMGFDPLRGYSAKEKSLKDRHVREAIKEIAQLDGAIIIDPNGSVVAACRRINSPATGITMSKGLGSRHWAAAAVTKSTKAVAVVVSQSSGTVRIFHNGQIELLIPPLRRAMKWQEPDTAAPHPPEWLA